MSGQKSLFDEPSIADTYENIELPDVPEWERDELLSHEKEMLGFFLSGHPLLKYSDKLHLVTDCTSETITQKGDGTIVSVAGVVNSVREVSTKKKETMAYITIDDMKGFVTVIVFPDLYRELLFTINSDEPLRITGKVDAGEEDAKLVATEISTLQEALKNPYTSVHIHIDVDNCSNTSILDIKALLDVSRGNYPVYLHMCSEESRSDIMIYLGDSYLSDIRDELKISAARIPGITSVIFM